MSETTTQHKEVTTKTETTNPSENQKPEISDAESQRILDSIKKYKSNKENANKTAEQQLTELQAQLKDVDPNKVEQVYNKNTQEATENPTQTLEKSSSNKDTQPTIEQVAEGKKLSEIWKSDKPFLDKIKETGDVISEWFGGFFDKMKKWFMGLIPDNIKEMIGLETSPEFTEMKSALERSWEVCNMYKWFGSDLAGNTGSWKKLFLNDKKFDNITITQFRKAYNDSIVNKKDFLKIDTPNEDIENVMSNFFGRQLLPGSGFFETYDKQMIKHAEKVLGTKVDENTLTVKQLILLVNKNPGDIQNKS